MDCDRTGRGDEGGEESGEELAGLSRPKEDMSSTNEGRVAMKLRERR